MVKSNFNNDNQLLISFFEGDIVLTEITDYINATRLNKTFPRKLKILTDSRKSNMLLKPEDLPLIVEANNRSLDVYDYIVDAIVLNNPHDTAITYLYGELSKKNNYFFKLFSDYETAKNWLLNFYPDIK